MEKIKVAIAGVGNCCSALVQGLYNYTTGEKIGLIHEKVAGFTASDVEIVAAIDVDARKVGRELSRAIFAEPNKNPRLIEVPRTEVVVSMGHFLDDLEHNGEEMIELAEEDPVDVVKVLKNTGAEIFINVISGSAIKSSEYYAEMALKAGCAFVNATPAPIASTSEWAEKYKDAGLIIVGDDLMSQIGATVFHIGLLEFLNARGVHVDESYQLDVGGGAESVNTLWKTRKLKRDIKTSVVSKAVPYNFPLVSGSTDYVDFLGNNRDSFFWFKGKYFNNAPFNMDVKLTTMDAPNAGAVMLDIIRGVKAATLKGDNGPADAICSYGFKRPPIYRNLTDAINKFREYVGA